MNESSGVNCDGPLWPEVVKWVRRECTYTARRRRLDPHERDDLEQHVWVRIVKELPRFDPNRKDATVRTWVTRHVAWSASDFFRARRSQPPVSQLPPIELESDATDDPSHAVERADFINALRACLAKLNASQRERVRLVYAGESSLAAIARELDIVPKSLRESVARATVALRRCLASAGITETTLFGPPSSGGQTTG